MTSQGREGGGDPRGGLLFTAFEPSGDCLAAPVIDTIRRREPQVPIWAFGGGRMEAAGATLIERTTDRAVMLAGIAVQARRHQRRLAALKRWLADHPLAVHVPVDSPAANWSICRLVRRQASDASIVHLAAPQLWAWATWRVRRLRRLTDRVLCLLPFEPAWFARRGIPGVFVGHPLFDTEGHGFSDALHDHHAFSHFPRFDVVAIPVSDRFWNAGADDLGLEVFEVTPEGGIEHLGKVEHEDVVLRSLVIDENLYSLSRTELIVTEVDDPDEVAGELSY